MKYLILLLFLPSLALATGQKYQHKDRLVDDEFANAYHAINSPNFVYGRASTMTVTQLNVSSITLNGVNLGGGADLTSFRNRVINGEMRIDQANVGAAVTVNNALTFYSADQFTVFGVASAGVYTVQRVTTTPPAGFTHYMHFVVTTSDATNGAGELYFISSSFEGSALRDLLLGSSLAKPFTLSFYVRSSLTGTFDCSITNSASDRYYIAPYTINSANTWEQKIITFPGDTTGTWPNDTGRGAILYWDLGSGFGGTSGAWNTGYAASVSGHTRFIGTNGATFDLTGVQLETGSTASAFEYRPHQVELALCERYFWIIRGNGTALAMAEAYNTTAFEGGKSYFPVTMRVAPTCAVSSLSHFIAINSAGGTAGGAAVSALTPSATVDGWKVTGSAASGLVAGNATQVYLNNASGYLSFDARM